MEAQQQAVSDQMPGLPQEDAVETLERETITLRRGNSLLCSQLNELLGDGMLESAQAFREKRARDPRVALMDYKGQFADLVQRCSTALSSSSSMMAYLLRRAQRAEVQVKEVLSSSSHRRHEVDKDTSPARHHGSVDSVVDSTDVDIELPAKTWLVHTTGYLQNRVRALEKELAEARADRRDLMREIHRRKAMGLWDAKDDAASSQEKRASVLKKSLSSGGGDEQQQEHVTPSAHASGRNTRRESTSPHAHAQSQEPHQSAAQRHHVHESTVGWGGLVHTRHRTEMDNLWDKVQQESVAAQKMVDELKRKQDQELESREQTLHERKARLLEAEKALAQRRTIQEPDVEVALYSEWHSQSMSARAQTSRQALAACMNELETVRAVDSSKKSDEDEMLWVSLSRSREAIGSLKRARDEDATVIATLLEENEVLRKDLAALRGGAFLNHVDADGVENAVSVQEMSMLEARCAVLTAEVAALERLCAMRSEEAQAVAQVRL
jgi:hypothetical protein